MIITTSIWCIIINRLPSIINEDLLLCTTLSRKIIGHNEKICESIMGHLIKIK